MNSTHPNHRYLVDQVVALKGPDCRALDYGCGSGEAVIHACSRGIDMVGVDVFYAGSSSRRRVAPLIGKTVFEIDGTLPFADASFDVVCSNQVFEHVEDMDLALSEIRRVLRPGGVFLNLFPTVGVLREGHVGIPFAHWLQPLPSVQRVYMHLLRLAGLGHHKGGRSCGEWAAYNSAWLQRFTVYRTRRAIYRLHLKHFATIERIEDHFASYRLREAGRPLAAHLATLLGPLTRLAVSRLGTMVLLIR